jgi:glycogen synthase
MATPRYLPSVGGVERYVEMLSRRLVERGVGVTVVTADPSRALPPHERVDGVDILRVPAWPRGRDYYFAPELYRIARAPRWDLVHVQSYHTLVAPLAMLAAGRAHTPYVLTFHAGGHSSRLRSRLRGAQLTLLRPLLARAQRLVALARFEIDLYSGALRLERDRFALIPTGVDLPTIASPAPSGNESAPVIASVGRLERYKGHHRLVEALPAILQTRPDARVWIAGSGPYEEALAQLARELGVADRVEIRAVAAQDRRAMAEQLSRMALVVLFSDYETLPIAVLEALALRRPVLVTHSTGLDELAEKGLVRAVPHDSGPEQIAAAVLEQLRDPFVPARLDLPTWDDCAAQHHELYSSILDGARGLADTPGGALPKQRGSFYYASAHRLHRVQAARARRAQRGADPWESGLRILCYHRVSPEPDELSVAPGAFRDQMESILRAHAQPEPLDDALDRLEEGAPGRHVCVTFDDGYHDNLDHAIPVLRELGIPATIFVASAVTDGRAPMYWYEHPPPLLSWSELRAISQESLFSIGAHSRTHPELAKLPDEAAWEEIAGSRRDLEERLGRPVASFAYPGGFYGERELRMVAEAGYRVGLTCEPGVNGPGQRPQALHRVLIEPRDDRGMFEAKLLGLLDSPWGVRDALALPARLWERTTR